MIPLAHRVAALFLIGALAATAVAADDYEDVAHSIVDFVPDTARHDGEGR